MFTTCPHCQTSFKITAEQLRLAAGKARCGQCQNVFNSLYSLKDGLKNHPLSLPDPTEQNTTRADLLSLKGKDYPNEGTTRHTEVVQKQEDDKITEVNYYNNAQNERSVFSWLFLSLLLLLALPGQYLHFNSYYYSNDPIFRPVVKMLCKISHCPVTLPSAPNKIAITDGAYVTPNPQLNNIMDIELSFRNNATFSQRYPHLRIIFTNTFGQLIAKRIFTPQEYLINQPLQIKSISNGVKPQQQINARLQIMDPLPNVSLGYEVSFL